MKFMGSIFKTFILSLSIVGQIHFAYAQTASILPNAKTTFLDANGKPLAGGNVTFSIPGTTTPKTTWQDAAETIPNTDPVILDSAGRALILGSGAYRQIVKDQFNNLIWDQVTASPGASGGGGATVGDGTNVGTILPWSGFVAPTNYMFAAGEAISRTTFSALLAAITQTQLVTCVGGSPILNTVADTSQLPIGAPVEAACIPSGSVIVSTTSNTVTINNSAIIGTTVTAQFFPFGNGDGAATFNVPDFRGKTLVARNNMGGAASSLLTSAFYSNINPNALGASGGQQAVGLGTTNMAAYTPTGSIAVTNGTITNTVTGGIEGSPGSLSGVGTGATIALSGATAIVVTSSQAASTASFTGAANGGSSAPFSVVQPSETVNYIIKVLPDTSLSVATINQLSPGTPNELAGTDTNGMWGNITVPTGLTVANSALNFNIPALPLDSSPNANNNYVPEYDAAGNITARVSLGQIAASATAGVETYNGLTGSVGGTNIQTTNYTIANTDCEKTVQAGTGSTGLLTITLPSVSGFPAACRVIIKDGDALIGKKLSGFPAGLTSPNILWPLKSFMVGIVNNAWTILIADGRWKSPNNVQLYMSVVGGNDTNDCLAVSRPCATFQQTLRTNVKDYFDLTSQSAFPDCMLTVNLADNRSSGVYYGLAHIAFNPTGAEGRATICIVGDSVTPSNVVISDPGGGNVAAFGNVNVQLSNLQIGLEGNTAIAQNGVDAEDGANIWLQGGVIFGTAATSQISAGNHGTVTALQNISVVGGATNLIADAAGGQIDISGHTVTFNNAVTYSGQTVVGFSGSTTILGSWVNGNTVTGPKFFCRGATTIETDTGDGTSIPGTVAGSTGPGCIVF